MGLGKGGGVPGKTSQNGTIGGPDSESYHQRPTRLPAETVDSIPGRLRKLANAASAYIEFEAMRPYSHLKRYM